MAEVSMYFGRTVMADVSFDCPMCHLADQSDIRFTCQFWPVSIMGVHTMICHKKLSPMGLIYY